MRGTAVELHAFEGQRLGWVAQRGKFLTLQLESGRIVINAMLTGRLSARRHQGPSPSARRRSCSHSVPRIRRPDDRCRGGLDTRTLIGCPPTSPQSSCATGTPSGWARSTSCPTASNAKWPAGPSQGPDADDPALDLTTWQARLRRHNGELGNLLKNQELVAGIGNAYSDEILWAARIGPFRKAPQLGGRGDRATLGSHARDTVMGRGRGPPTCATPLRGAGA